MAASVEYSGPKVLERLAEVVELTTEDFAKPKEEWTPAMKRWAFDEEPLMARSQDGKTEDRRGGWDCIGTRVKIRVADKLKALELIGKLKSIDAFVQQQKQGDVNVVVVTAERAREVQSARKRLARIEHPQVIDVEPSSLIEPKAEEGGVMDGKPELPAEITQVQVVD